MSDFIELTFVSHRLDRRGGQEKSSHEVLSRLVKKGHRVHIVSFSVEDWDISKNGGSWHKVPGRNIPVQLLKNLWFSIYTFIYLFFKKPDLTMTIGVSSWLADVRLVQFVHFRYLLNVRNKRAPLPNERTIIHKIYQVFFMNWTVFLEKKIFNKTKYFVAISHRIKEEIEEIIGSYHHATINVIHHAPDETVFKNKLIPSQGDLQLLFVGALERKGVQKVIDVLTILDSDEWFMNIVGDGDLKRWRNYVKRLSLSHKISIHGAMPSVPFFEDAHVFVFPSTYEPFGLVVSEAISYGALPMASSECGAMELWNNRSDFLQLSANDDAEKWAESLSVFLHDRKLLKEKIEEASDYILKRSWDQAACEYESYLLAISKKNNQDIYS